MNRVAIILLTVCAWVAPALGDILYLVRDTLAYPQEQTNLTAEAGAQYPLSVRLLGVDSLPYPLDDRSARFVLYYNDGIGVLTASVYNASVINGEGIVYGAPTFSVNAGSYLLRTVVYEQLSGDVVYFTAGEVLTVTNALSSGGDVTLIVTNQFAPSTTNYWDIGLTNVISVSNTISVGNTSVTNTIINTITNYMDATVTVPGLTVTVSQITVPINRLTAIGEVSGLVATTQGDGSVSWLDRAGAVDAYATTNYLARVDTIRVGAGLIGSIDGGALNIEYLGQGLPPMPPGTAITNVVAYTPGGANTGMWVQASSGVTSWYVHAVGAGGGLSGNYAGGLGGTSVAMLRVTPLAWYYVEVGAAGANGYTITNSLLTANTNAASYPGGGLGWTRGIYVGANGGGYSAIWDGVPDRATATNLMLIAGGGGGAGPSGIGGGGGGTVAWDGAGATVGYIAAGANGTNVALAVPWESCIVTGQSPGLLVGGDAQVLTNAQAGVNSGSGGGGGGYGGGAGGVSLNGSVRGGGGGGSGYINTAYVIAAHDRPAITIRAPLASSVSVPSLSESPEYRVYGGVAGMSGKNGVVIIGEVISL